MGSHPEPYRRNVTFCISYHPRLQLHKAYRY